tara:strand:- start:763 stop:1179 length:417 start_codon:yes stop_codon:yes gene_type:complete
MNKFKRIFNRILAILAALILLQTLYFKFSAHPDSVQLFTELGMEPWGRIGIGILELIAGLLLLYPKTTSFGALLSFGIISGAVFFHLFVLGIEVNNDGGGLFAMALAVFISSLILIIMNWKELLANFQGVLKKSNSMV